MDKPPTPEGAKAPGLPTIDVNEYGGKKDGERQTMNRRLFMQLLVFDAPAGAPADAIGQELAKELRQRKTAGVVYADAANPRGLGLLSWSEDPAHFVRAVRPLFGGEAMRQVTLRPEFTMFGRSYSSGHEPDLAFMLLERPVAHVLNEKYPWHIWYPLRRTGAFARLEPQVQSGMLREHAQIGMAYGQQELAHDIRLACHALDAADNEFVIGLVGHDLHPLSHLVQAMRKTQQTSEYIEKMGPFFVGHVVHRNA
jgi:chlorite dismutase